LALLIEAATGIGMRDGGWVEVADRIAATERTYNGREGLTRHDDTLPSRLFDDAVTDGPNKGQVIGRAELETLKDDFYQAMNWNVETGLPTVERLRFLELNDIAQELEQAKTYARS
jgi:aldehyde:ferredoxin oxidoreductase